MGLDFIVLGVGKRIRIWDCCGCSGKGVGIRGLWLGWLRDK